jgi:rhomboid family GlyGly-CTERM serine protease
LLKIPVSLQQIRLAKSWPGFACLSVVICLAALLPEPLQRALAFEHSAIITAEYWRLLTGHLIHSNAWHLAMNLAGLGLVLLLHGRYYSTSSMMLYFGCAALSISYMLVFISADIQVYVGLSGVLHALLCIGAIKDMQHYEPTGKLLFFGLFAKVAYEQWQGPDADLAQLIKAEVAIDAHLYGVITGLLLALMLSLVGYVQHGYFLRK